ncbi:MULTISPECIES: beta-ketoacyl synthase [unclassified Crossiella]|uniref:beta-ketoacyl-[acyl-carrier-protein] synthase family protein n=1 Tax=unclassified Crossiella TaxID=2620835 RepID=UPI001FFFA572|nr:MULTISPECIES: beta-ketoacyl-[acyl-carrier-protein] synthase family protein [unclassified Crossiella]MCK2241339.1 beta-ketoacyl-[acyl-carrier-protein] synthase family protein [Crossiella sp. S99.2]MCK2253517.1 beta-ketoacyl-[acyl-carrier-protein] synthase family protein [Crossiella sp. S99.1]
MARRAVITGIGVTAPGGIGTQPFWDLLVSGRTATRRITAFDPAAHRCQVAAEIDFDPLLHGLTRQEVRRTDRATQLALVSAREAVLDSGLVIDGELAERTGVALGSAVGGTTTLEREYAVLSNGGKDWVLDPAYAVPHLYEGFLPSSIAAEVAVRTGALGPASVISTGCTSGIDSVGYAAELVRDGAADVMITGATDAPISPITLTCFDSIKATSARNDDPATACRPFDRNRTGLILGEGSAVLVLEEYEHARRRGATIYAEVGGYAARCNAFHMTGLKADGREMAEAINLAMAEAGLNPEDIDYVNAHGSGTRQNDRHETAAVKRSLGEHAYRTPMSGIKAIVGHSLGAIGSIEIAACALSIKHGVVVPTANLTEADPECDLDYVPGAARERRLDAVLTVGSGFGGFQSALALSSGGRAA